MTDVASLLDSVSDLACVRCGRRNPDTFTDLPGLEAFLSGPRIPYVAGRVPPALVPIRTITADDLTRFGPVHAACLRPRPGRPGNSSPDRPPYNLLDSVR